MELVAHLRRDNMRLREALIAAEEEAATASKVGNTSQSVDFKHLLSLVRDFGGEEWCSGDGGTTDPSSPLPVSEAGSSTRCSTSPGFVKMGTPGGGTEIFSLYDDDDGMDEQTAEDVLDEVVPCASHEVQFPPKSDGGDSPLDRELAKSREEVLHLRAKLEASQREVRRLMGQVEVS